ncbi:Na/Pi cotransporter family protein [Effusibacillus pohliae]|uniref:Na/Pi cotransporter family protein n=1 Tax=Effusibacillus pohliae TaxID=232270 RepID=UPI00037E081F|nr:Na/Pi symporter [Effusibacillus pohliae]
MYTPAFLLAAGLAGFLGGIWVLRHGLEQMAMERLPQILQRFVKTPTRGLITGTVVSALLHSSAAVTVITIGFVSAGTMTFADSLGVILGSNIGTTVTTQIVAWNPDDLIFPCTVLGVLMWFALKGKKRYLGLAVFGFGATLFALNMMTRALAPLGDTDWFPDVLQASSQNPIYGVLAGAGLTALVQSSTATTALTIAMAGQGLIDLPGAIAIVFGNNVGTCITAVLAAIGSPLPAKRVAAAHVLLNVAGVLAFLPILDLFSRAVQLFSSSLPVQVATAHTLFNIASSLAVWPFTGVFARLIEWMVPGRGKAE